MGKLILLLALVSCGQANEEVTIDGSMCIESCIERNLKDNSGNRNDAYRYCADYILPKSTCYTQDNKTFYYR